MIPVVLIGRSLDPATRVVVSADPGQTVAEVRALHQHPEWEPDAELQHMVGGRVVDERTVLRDGDVLTIGPAIGLSAVTITLAVITLAGTAYGYWRSKKQLAEQKRAQELRESGPYGFDTPALTAYGEGFRIPIVYGEMRTGGVVIGSRLEASSLFRYGTEAVLLIALSEGPVESIGGLTLEPTGEADYLTGATYVNNGLPDPRFPFNTWQFPTGLRINGFEADSKTTVVSLRKGRLNQSPIPDWPGAETSVDVSGSNLVSVGQSTTHTTTETDVWSVVAELRFPEGLWFAGTGGTVHGRFVDVELAYRIGTGAWIPRTVRVTADPPALNQFSHFVDFQVFPAGGGPFELRVTRVGDASNNHMGGIHNTFFLKSVQIRYGGGFEYSFAYPGLALLSVRMPATEQTNGALNNVSIPIRGKKVRGWINSTLGWTAEGWEAVTPWSFPIGNNPAWVFVDLCLSKRYGLGNLITEADLDLDAFRDWADLCDQPHPLDAAKPLLRFDGIIDDGADAVEQLVRIAAAGRAIPILGAGNKLSVKFSYRDEFSRGSGSSLNVVPDRAPVGVITSSGVARWEATYTDPSTAPVVIDQQIVDASAEYELRVVSGVDEIAPIADNGVDPITRAPRRDYSEARGVTRRLQARHEIQLAHNHNRLSGVEVRATLPVEALPLEVGDLVIWQNDALLSGGAATQSARTTNAGTVSNLVLSKPINVTGANPRTDFGVWFVDDSGDVQALTADLGSAQLIQAGANLPLWDPVAMGSASVSIQRGAQVACGPFATTARLFEVLSIATTHDLQREIVAAEWHEDMFDLPPGFDVGDGLGGESAPAGELITSAAVEVQGVMAAGGEFRSTSLISFAPSATASAGRRARVYARTEDGWFSLLGETATDRLDMQHLRPGGTYQIHVCRENGNGQFPAPGLVTPVEVTIPEFGSAPPGDVERLRAAVLLDRVVLEWPHVDDSIAYELRRGDAWYGAELLYQGRHNRYELIAPPVGTATYFVRARGASGLYSVSDAMVSASFVLLTTVETATALESDVTTGGTATDIVWDAGEGGATLDEDEPRGTWESDELDVGADTLLYWSAGATFWAIDGSDFADFPLGAPTGHWSIIGGREPTRVYPGADFTAGPAVPPSDPELYADPSASTNVLGQWSRGLIETRFYTDAAADWSAWAVHEPGRRLARKMQARVTLDRWALDIQPYVRDLVLTAGF